LFSETFSAQFSTFEKKPAKTACAMSMLKQFYLARLIPSDYYYRKDTTRIGPTGVVAPVEIAHAEIASAEIAPAEIAPAEIAPAEIAPAEIAPAEAAPAEAAPIIENSIVYYKLMTFNFIKNGNYQKVLQMGIGLFIINMKYF
jgi:hypothetical protein